MLRRTIALLSLLTISPAWGQSAETKAAPVPQTLEQAEAQRKLAETMRNDAEKRYATEQAACYQKILVNDCLVDAKRRYTQAIIDARLLDAPARDFQREAHRNEVEAEKAQREAERPAREAEQRERAERYREEEAAKAAERAQKQADRERKAEENRKKLAEEQAKRQAQQEKRARKHAEQIEKKARERAKAEAKAAAREPGK